MPRGDGTGPGGRGRGTGRGMGPSGSGRGRSGGSAAGLGGNCICPNCGERLAHQTATPCFERKCPKCGAVMMRE
jgi:hypothetical protein